MSSGMVERLLGADISPAMGVERSLVGINLHPQFQRGHQHCNRSMGGDLQELQALSCLYIGLVETPDEQMGMFFIQILRTNVSRRRLA